MVQVNTSDRFVHVIHIPVVLLKHNILQHCHRRDNLFNGRNGKVATEGATDEFPNREWG